MIVEVHLAAGLPAFSIVGLPDLEVRESRERVRAALQNCNFEFPVRRITVNLAPADLPKESGGFDLPIALGILAASQQIPSKSLENREFSGELSLTGALRPVRGAFAIACQAARDQAPGAPSIELYLPMANAAEGALVPGIDVFGASTLLDLCAHLRRATPSPVHRAVAVEPPPVPRTPDMADVVGQSVARRALEVAAAGAHHLLMTGPPGAGKSMLAARLPGLLPAMTTPEALAVAALASASRNGFNPSNWRRRPFRAPHHSASAPALIGGGNPPRAGEVTLAHHGVLFLDELAEFERRTLEMLREPLENGVVTISRAAWQLEFPACCQVVAAMNPCPCGWHGDPRGRCRCTPDRVDRYQQRISGALLDRIDIRLSVNAVQPDELAPSAATGEPSAAIAARVAAARNRQVERQGKANRLLTAAETDAHCRLGAKSAALVKDALARFGWSARTHFRVLRLARTVADLAGVADIDVEHVAEAIQYQRG